MQTTSAVPDKVTSTIKAIGTGVFLCNLVILVLGIVTAKDHPVPIDIRGCYKIGDQTLQVEGTRIIVNGGEEPDVTVRYKVTNIGRQIETVDGWLELNQAKPPHKKIDPDAIIRVEDNVLLAFTGNGEGIPFTRMMPQATCGNVVNRPVRV
jgi:hypothetical protein